MGTPCAFDTDLLDAPSEDFQMFGGSDAERERDRALNVESYQRIVKYHTWGLKYTIEGRKTKGKFFALLKKIVFNQQSHLRAKNWRSFILCDCDAGPGLLEPRYNAPRISRRNPNGAITEPSGLSPFKTAAPQLLPGPLGQQPAQGLSQPISSLGQIRPYPQRKQTPATDLPFRPLATPTPLSHTLGFQVESGPNSSGAFPSSLPDATGQAFTNQGSALSLFPDLPDIDMSAGADFDYSMGDLPQSSMETSHANHPVLHNADKRAIIEAVEREAMRIAYQGLERHPLAFPIGTCNTLTIESAQDFQSSLMSFSGARQLRLARNDSGLVSRLDPNGTLYAYRGRGPISSNNSSPVDCTIVAGKLLDAGSTRSDRGDGEDWTVSLTQAEEAFLEATSLNWEVFTENASAETRDDFWKLLNGRLNYIGLQFRFGESLPPTALWDISTASFQQFRLAYEETVAPCPCRNTTGDIPSTALGVSSIVPRFEENDRLGVTMQVLLNRFFERYEQRICPACGKSSDVAIKSFGELPLRLVVKPDPRVLLRHHTSNEIFFNYVNRQNQEAIGTYRWLGGVYRAPPNQADRYAIFWTDDKRGEAITNHLCMYDGTQNVGAIVGSISPSDREERIPTEWWAHGAVPLLFYERVINPSLDTLTIARDTVNRMIRTVEDKKLILEDHQPWTKSDGSRDGAPPRRQYLNSTPNTSEIGCHSKARANGRIVPTSETRISPEQDAMIPSEETKEMQVENARSEVEPNDQPSEEQMQLQANPWSEVGLQLGTQSELGTDNTHLAREIQDFLGPEHFSSSLPRGQQLANLEQRSNHSLQLIPESPQHAAAEQNYVSLTDEDLRMLWQQMNMDIPFHPSDNGKRPRSPSNTFHNGADGNVAPPSPKKQRCE